MRIEELASIVEEALDLQGDARVRFLNKACAANSELRREVVTHLATQGGLPVQRACQAVGLSRATYYRPVVNWAQPDGPVIESLAMLGTTKPRWEFWTYVNRLRLTGHRGNHKHLWRGYCRLRLTLPRRAKTRLPVRPVHPMDVIPQPKCHVGARLHE